MSLRLKSHFTPICLAFGTCIAASGQDWSVELYAAPIDAVDVSPGHAFLCLSLNTANGKREECFGFYPTNGTKAVIRGPGIVVNEFKKNPERFSKITVSVSARITQEQRKTILKEMNDWNSKNYSLTKQNCADFVVTAVKAIGWKVPNDRELVTPEAVLSELKKLNPQAR